VNGSDPGQVSTQYLVEYCAGSDFFVCQQQNAWQSTGIAGQGGARNMVLGTWDTANFSPGAQGPVVLRLSVTSTNKATGAQQIFSDYATTYVYTNLAGAYNDPVLNPGVPASCANGPILNARTGVSYSSLDQCLSEASSGDVLKLHNKAVVTSNTLILDKEITLDGGYDCGYANKIGMAVSTVRGETNVLNGVSSIRDIWLDSAPSLQIGTSNFTLTGTMQTGSTVAVSATNGAVVGPVVYTSPTTWSCAISGLLTGDNVLTVTTTGPNGEQATTTTTITYNPAAPAAVPALGPWGLLVSAALLTFLTRRRAASPTPERQVN
jgi:hypothetical protein